MRECALHFWSAGMFTHKYHQYPSSNERFWSFWADWKGMLSLVIIANIFRFLTHLGHTHKATHLPNQSNLLSQGPECQVLVRLHFYTVRSMTPMIQRLGFHLGSEQGWICWQWSHGKGSSGSDWVRLLQLLLPHLQEGCGPSLISDAWTTFSWDGHSRWLHWNRSSRKCA